VQYTDLNAAPPSGNTNFGGKGKLSTGFFAALVLADPYAKDFFVAVKVDAGYDIGCLCHDLMVVSNLVVDGVHKDKRINAVKRPRLLFRTIFRNQLKTRQA
jgi:hypothetical protein